jgi:tRNA threonylcarbamoyl adenosine modification protein YeaZ
MQLALETATNICSVAFRDREGEVHEKRTEVRKSHSEQLFLFIEALMQKHDFTISDLDAMVVSEGPGSYTGLRISASAVKGLLFQTDVSLYRANTLASFALSGMKRLTHSGNSLHSIIDARRVHVYHQQFAKQGENLKALSDVKIIPIKEFQELIHDGDLIIGTGLHRIDEQVSKKARALDADHITAGSLLKLLEQDQDGVFVKRVEPERFEPHYYTSNQV